MNFERPLFVLAGSAPYLNRGCEAIVRGSIEILRHYYDNPAFVVISFFNTHSQLKIQRESDTDKSILHERLTLPQMRLGLKRFLLNGRPKVLLFSLKNYRNYKRVLNYFNDSNAVLSVGGDNYSLDYSVPERFTTLDDLVLAKKRPLVLWGASVGPFSKIPEYEVFMKEHLKKVTGIFARELCTVEYLKKLGISKNVYRVADPGFLMKPVKPPKVKFDLEIPNESIGLNLSPLMAAFASKDDTKNWLSLSTHIVEEISTRLKRPLYLIAHVTRPELIDNDYVFLKEVLENVEKGRENIRLVTENLNAAETKWVISKMAVFAGARTHSTIAAISSGIPTLSFAYSIKAKGINQDVYGHDDYCLDPTQLGPKIVADKIEELVIRSDEIKSEIYRALPEIEKLAMDAGKYLKDIITDYDAGGVRGKTSMHRITEAL